ncbi:dihydroorotate dehydrogenase-like protein [Alkalitalea saponilacus]|uniref:Dihydroorotate dehydrogenase (Fumarate) n=1 Tax=Alkalitalea saponilacus TaxID=889453 RepID=A0A1T5HSG3_9BACT|nr:dihydroorotate dehydrogenase-like protein [Alkalitalea saponilacus]ASB48328.1 dihydroorotate dehydrogenase [Alkalitalea saponilacus]SKC23552.1 dihydroorotate dehydrogenase (fumarate) [Alkalitalea saponilacus]
MNLSTNYLGLKLKNPVIVGACNLSLDIAKAKELEEAGASAIVFKSLFEEQLNLEAAQLSDDLHQYDDRNAEMLNLFPNIEHSGPKAHLLALKELKENVSIPVIASLNCIYKESWEEYALHLADAGADALELNFYATITDADKDPHEIENMQIEVLKKIKDKVKIPVSVKLSPYYTNPLAFIKRLEEIGADGYVLFNRLFQPDIDVWEEALQMPYNLSKDGDNRLSLRYMGLLSGQVKGSLVANTGILKGTDVAASILAGADAVQVVSTLYKNGTSAINTILNELSDWMNKKGYSSIDDFKGKMSKSSLKQPYAYKRAQYVDFLMKASEFENHYPVK